MEEHCCQDLSHILWDWHFQGERSPVRRWLVLPVGAAELVIFISSLGAGVHTLTQPPRSCRAPVGRQYLRDNRWTFLLATSVHTIRYVLRFHPEEEQKNSRSSKLQAGRRPGWRDGGGPSGPGGRAKDRGPVGPQRRDAGRGRGCWLARGVFLLFRFLFFFQVRHTSHEKGEQTEDAPSAFVSFQININTFTSKVYEHFL